MKNKLLYNCIFLFLIAILVFVDYLSKKYIVNNLGINHSIDIIEGFLRLTHIRNSGAAFGILNNKSIFLIFMPIAVTAIFAISMFKTDSVLSKLAISLIISGALGNLIDRMRQGYVVDMIDFYKIWRYIFNAADIYVVSGCVILIILLLSSRNLN